MGVKLGFANLTCPSWSTRRNIHQNARMLSASRGHGFDTIHVMDALVQLQTLYRDFTQTGADPGLQVIAVRELPKVEQTISALNTL
ncbi:MAG: hypothetical protein ACREDM_10655 [Methylocella sp.]